MAQALLRQEDGERLLLIEITVENGGSSLAMLTPFGLDVSKGATLQVDENKPLSLPFSTCLPNGCVVRQTMSPEEIEGLGNGTTLKTSFSIARTDDLFSMTSSLQGFSSAYKRLGELNEAR